MSQVAADALVEEANELFRLEQFSEALARYERAALIYPPHPLAWKGVGHSLLSLGKPHDAARAFDRAIGLAPKSATALWGGAVAHAEIGNKVVAQSYLRRTLALQPQWAEMARGVPALAAFLQVSARAGEALRAALGAFSTRTYRHTADESRSVEVGRLVNRPQVGQWTYATIGLSNREWPEVERPRVELLLATTLDTEVCGQILANLAFHLSETGFFPEPSVVVRDVVGALGAGDLSQRLPHVYIMVPRVWGLELPLDAGPPPITLAQVVPVSEAEYQLWRDDVGGFEQELAQRGVDVADLRRKG
jgi:tetratricopeptide (TPR) repeat protein